MSNSRSYVCFIMLALSRNDNLLSLLRVIKKILFLIHLRVVV